MLPDESENTDTDILEIFPENSADTHIAAHDPSAVLTNITVTDTQNRDSQNQNFTSVIHKVQNNTQMSDYAADLEFKLLNNPSDHLSPKVLLFR